MTDVELEVLEAAAKAATPGPWKYEGPIIVRELSEISWQGVDIDKRQNMAYIAAANPAAILSLIAELRQARKERDWLAEHRPARYCPTVEKWETCLVDVPGHKLPKACIQCWIDRAKEATSCQK